MTDKKIQLSKEDKKNLERQLEAKLARKEVIETQLTDVMSGGGAYMALVEALKQNLKTMGAKTLLYTQRVVELRETEFKAEEFVNQYRNLRREYEYFLLPEVKEICTALDIKPDGIEFQDYEKLGKEFMQKRIYRETTTLPSNVEHTKMLNFYKRHIQLRKNLIIMMKKKIEDGCEGLEQAELRVGIFNEERHLETLERRYQKRLDYHNNTFLPIYNADMEECSIYLDKYLQRAKELANIDPTYRLKFLLQEHEANKTNDENLWLFYTALRSRIDEMISTFSETPEQFKDKLHLIQPIRENGGTEKGKGKKKLSAKTDN